MGGFGEGKRAEREGPKRGCYFLATPRATPEQHPSPTPLTTPVQLSAAPSSDCCLPLVPGSRLPPSPTMESLDFPSIHSIEEPAPPDTLTLPPPSPVDDPSHPRPEEPLPSAIEAAADASASGSGPHSGKPPSPFTHRPPTPRPRSHGSGDDEGDDSEGEGEQPQSPKDPHPQKRAKTEGAFQCLHTCFADPQHRKEFSHRSSRDRHMSSLFLHPSPPCGDACPGRQSVLKFEADKLEKERKAKGEQDRGAKDEAPAEEEEEGAPASKRKSRKGKGGGGGATRRRPSRGREWSMWRFLHASQMRLLISMSTPLMRSRVKTDVGGRGALLVPTGCSTDHSPRQGAVSQALEMEGTKRNKPQWKCR